MSDCDLRTAPTTRPTPVRAQDISEKSVWFALTALRRNRELRWTNPITICSTKTTAGADYSAIVGIRESAGNQCDRISETARLSSLLPVRRL